MIFMIIFGVALLVAVSVGAWYLLVGRFYVSTDDAYVAATTAQITPRVDGTIASVPIHDTMHVKKAMAGDHRSLGRTAGSGAGRCPICGWLSSV